MGRPCLLSSGVPQVSSLGTLLFNVYVSGLIDTVSSYSPVAAHAYADDFQVYLSFCPSSSATEERVVQAIQDCVVDIKSWARQHCLILNYCKNELLVFRTRK